MKTTINSMNTMKNGNGINIAFNYSVIDELGNKVKDNERLSFVVVDDALENHLKSIEDILIDRVKTNMQGGE